MEWVINTIIMVGLRLFPQRGVHPPGKLLCWGIQTFPKACYGVLLKLDATGEIKRKIVKIETRVFHKDGDELTAMPDVACLLQYLDGSTNLPGLWMMGYMVEPILLLKFMERVVVKVKITIT